MHGPPLTLDEIAAQLTRQVAALTDLGVELGAALKTVAKRHQILPSTVGRLLAHHQRLQNRRAGLGQVA